MTVARLGVTAHLLLAGLLAWMGALVGLDDIGQAQSGYLPPIFPLTMALAAVPVLLGVALVVTSVTWVRAGDRRLLAVVDGLTIVASWTFLPVLFFLPLNAMLPVLMLEPLALGLLIASPSRRKANDRHG